MSKSTGVVALGVFVVGLVFDYLLYWLVLGNALSQDAVLRTVMMGPWPKLIIGELIFSYAAAWIYARGVNATAPLGQGIRFGLALSFLFAVGGGLQIAPMIGASEFIIIGAIVGNAVKVLVQGITAALIAGPGRA
jgi:hypothetical protein